MLRDEFSLEQRAYFLQTMAARFPALDPEGLTWLMQLSPRELTAWAKKLVRCMRGGEDA